MTPPRALRDPVAVIIGAGALLCAILALALRPAPYPAAVAERWGTARVTASAAQPRYAFDRVVVDGRERPYDGRPVHLSPRGVFGVHGWAYETNGLLDANGFAYRIDRRAWTPATYGIGRPDVVAAFGLSPGTATGFDVTVPAAAFGPGRHVVQFALTESSGPVVLRDRIVVVVSVR